AAAVAAPVDCLNPLSCRPGVILPEDNLGVKAPSLLGVILVHCFFGCRIPVLGHADGICSVYVDKEADIEKAVKIVVDSKTNYTAACNSAETLLVNESLLSNGSFVKVASGLLNAGVTLKCEENVRTFLLNSDAISQELKDTKIEKAVEEDFSTEFLDLIMAVKTVPDVEGAIVHINEHGSKHTDAIVTENKETAEYFMTRVDAAGCYWNASTRFADGFRYGFGAEVGVSTNKTHARGPVGLEGLVIYKYKLIGNGDGAADFGSGKKSFKHETISPCDYKI
ncbi:hypothetical protein INT48_008774, partial [Thamnidium elegans]